jgi:hypothetical protein
VLVDAGVEIPVLVPTDLCRAGAAPRSQEQLYYEKA